MPLHETIFKTSRDALHGSEQTGLSAAHSRSPVTGRGVNTFCGMLKPMRWPEHSHACLEIGLLFDAADCDVTYYNGGSAQNHHIGSKQLWLVGADERHSAVWHETAGLLLLHVEPAFVADVVGHPIGGFAVHEFSRMAKSDLAIWETASLFRRLCQTPHAPHEIYLESLGTIFATHVLKAHCGVHQKAEPERILTPKQLRSVTEYIEKHLKEAISVDDLAKEACLSSYHFIRLFKRTTGLPPHRYLIRSRIEKAHELLRSGDHRVAEVAYEVGFCDQSHLDRHFIRHFGFTPKTVLQQRR